jgi:hypothetical protein
VSAAGFERFIGIDWSGAEGQFHRGIQVAEFFGPTRTLRLLTPPKGPHWTRHAVLNLITHHSDHRTLVGLDFCFSLPWSEPSADLPAFLDGLRGVRDLWAFVDDFCKHESFLYAGSMWSAEASPLRPFIKHWSVANSHEGASFKKGRFRRTEAAARKFKVRPISIYRMVGPQVGAGSFAGMRFLHALAGLQRKDVAIWPFDEIGDAKVVVCEVYPSLFYRLANCSRPTATQIKSGSHRAKVTNALGFVNAPRRFNSDLTIDALDALVAAAALQAMANSVDSFAASDDAIVTCKEGWIFGVPFGGVQ